ncbi:MAG: hypothetical protein K1Y36_27705 [Blastocatellia bacterium]|nr:hypothetical protein [Blastocatellia bacterium]
MTIADVLAFALGLIIVGVGFPALFLLLSFFFPKAVERSARQVKHHPGRSCALGLGLLVGLLLLVGIGKALPVAGKLWMLLSLVGGLGILMLGGAGMALFVAERFAERLTGQASLKHYFQAVLLVEVSFLLPVIGWFGVLPVMVLTMLGAGAAALVPPGQPANVPTPQPPVMPFPGSRPGIPVLE